MEIPLGSEVEDITDGFKGIVTSRTLHLNGCVQYYVRPPIDKKTGDTRAGCHIDSEDLKIIGPGCSKHYAHNHTVVPIKKAATGGPRRAKAKTKQR